jgi:hypothetical protein
MNDDNTDKLKPQKPTTDTLEWRVSNIEKHNQIRRIESQDGKTYFDTENSELVMEDGEIKAGSIEGATISGGEIDGAEITGGVFKTSASGQRIEIASNQMSIYDGDGTERQRIGGASQAFWDQNGDFAGQVYSLYNSSWGISVLYLDSVVDITDDLIVEGVLQCESDLIVLGDKEFNIPHPTKEGKRLVYSAIESPEVLVMCRGKKGEDLPQHFIDVSEPDTLDIITGVDGNWIATAVRKGFKDREVEPDDVKGLNPQHREHQKTVLNYDADFLASQDAIQAKESKKSVELK